MTFKGENVRSVISHLVPTFLIHRGGEKVTTWRLTMTIEKENEYLCAAYFVEVGGKDATDG